MKSFRSHYGSGGRLSLEQKWVPGAFPGGKCGRYVRLTTLPPSCAVVVKSGNLNFLEPSGPLQACNGTATVRKSSVLWASHWHVAKRIKMSIFIFQTFVISDFRREVDDLCDLLGYNEAYSGNSFPTFQNNHLQGSKPSSWILNCPFLYIHILEHNGNILSKKMGGGGILWVTQSYSDRRTSRYF